MSWTKEEIGKYKGGRRKELGPLYAAAGIMIHEPKKRVEYLGKKILNLTEENMKSLELLGNVRRLELLETMTLENFF